MVRSRTVLEEISGLDLGSRSPDIRVVYWEFCQLIY